MPPINLTGRRRLPVVLQAETAECALACLAMISGWHGRHEDLVSLRQKFGCGPRGTTLNGLLEAADELGFASRAVRCDLSEIEALSLPAILHWDFNHFVVAKSISRNSLIVHDPALGGRRLSLAQVSEHFTGVAVEFSPTSGFVTQDKVPRPGLLTYLGGWNGLIAPLLQLLALSAVLQLLVLATPFYMQLVVDEVLVKRDEDLLTVLAGGFLALSVFSLVTRWIRGWAGIYLTNQLSFTLGTRLFHRMMSLPAQFFMKRHMGDLVSRFGSLKPIQDFLANSTITLLLDGVMAMTTLSMMYLYSPLLSVVVMSFIAANVVTQVAFYVPLRRRQLESIAAQARADSNLMESIRSISAIKRYCIEPAKCNDWQNRYVDTINAKVRFGRLMLRLDVIQSGIMGIGNVLVVYLGARQVLGAQLSIGMLYAFMAWRSHLSGSASSLADTLVKYLMLSLHLERLADFSEAEPECRESAGARGTIGGSLRIRDGAFRYSRHDPWVFRHVELRVRAGDSLAVIGPSGCGKSTLMSIMMQMLFLEEGELWAGRHRVDATMMSGLRRNSASVMQDDTLLSGSIRSNITFGDSLPDVKRMQRVARIACIHGDIERLPMGYESLVGEMGTSLSAGQVQRILIARALYREPRFLFLDEGTAHLDKETEIKVMKRLLSLPFTCVFTTHNRSVLPLADKVLAMSTDGCRLIRVRRTKDTGIQKQRRIRSVASKRSATVVKPRVS